jgi:hypothetical protein
MAKHLLALLFMFFIASECLAQQPFLLFHKSRIREAKYYAGEVIAFRIKDNDFKVTDQIKGFKDGLILFDGYEVDPKDITHLYMDDKTIIWFALRFKLSRLCSIAGAAYLGLDLLNNYETDRSTIILGSSLIATGVLSHVIFRRVFKIKGKLKLVVIA